MSNIKIANAPCSWGALEFELEGISLGFQQVLDEMRDTGYAGTELGDWGFMPTDSSKLQHELQTRQLALLGAFVPVGLVDPKNHKDGEQAALQVAQLMRDAGYHDAFIVLADDNGTIPLRTQNAGRITPDMGLTIEQWEVYGLGANQIAKAIKDKFGMRTVFHHHCGGYVETPQELDQLLLHTDPDIVGLCLDTGHFAFGGGNPLSALKKYYNRIWHVHFKDYNPSVGDASRKNQLDYFESVKQGVFCELGKGNVDFKSVVAELKNKNYSGWIVVEQDVLPGMGKPKLWAKSNRDYLRTLDL